MGEREEVEAVVAVVIRQHEYALGLRRGSICTCGFVPTVDPGSLRAQQDYFVDHLASVVAASPAMRDLLAEAWDAAADEVPTSTGYSAGVPVWRSEVREWLIARNPHRSDA